MVLEVSSILLPRITPQGVAKVHSILQILASLRVAIRRAVYLHCVVRLRFDKSGCLGGGQRLMHSSQMSLIAFGCSGVASKEEE